MTNMSVLYITKNDTMTLFVQRVLENERPDLDYRFALNLKDGRTLLLQHHVDLVILDMDLPNNVSEEFLKWIKSHESLKHIFVIGAMAIMPGRPRMFSELDGYLSKPFGVSQLLGAVGLILGKEA